MYQYLYSSGLECDDISRCILNIQHLCYFSTYAQSARLWYNDEETETYVTEQFDIQTPINVTTEFTFENFVH